MGDSPDIFGDDGDGEEEPRPSASELEAAGQSALFGGEEAAPEPQAETQDAPPVPKAPEPDPPVTEKPAAKPEADAAQPYRVLARKYRPRTFAELIGQDAMIQTLANAIKRDRLAHAFLMTGVRGVGKTSTARLIAKALNCVGPDGQGGPTIDPCGQCEPCIAIAEGRHIDVIEMDAASHTGVDDVREIIEAVRYAAVSARYKIYIIDEVHMLSRNAFNALLKTLEEPPAHVKFLFATTEVEKLPVTVLSRCQRFDLKRIPVELLSDHFATICGSEGVNAEAEALAMIASAAEGSVRDGLSILDQAISHADLDGSGMVEAAQVREMLGLSDKGAMRTLFAALLAGDAGQLLERISGQYAMGIEPTALMRGAMELTHRITLAQVSGSLPDAASAEERELLEQWATSLSAGQLHRMWQLLLKGFEEVASAPDPLVAAQMALLRVMHASDMPDPGKLASRLEELAKNSGTSAPAPGAPDQAQPQSSASDDSWEALVGKLEASGALSLASKMRMQVRVIELGPALLHYGQPSEFGEDLGPELRAALLKLTGERWTIKCEGHEGAPTLVEQDETRKQARQEEMRRAPLVEAALSAFPDGELVDGEDGARLAGGSRNWSNSR